jgi:MATE family multidrug resistance protein
MSTQSGLQDVHPKGLTKYQAGSFREILTISFPLMLTALSINLMMFCDRLILAHYSTDAMNAVVTAGMACAIFQYGAFGITSIAEVFVGQYNGARDYQKVSEPVWQMIWFSLFTSLLFIPLAYFGGSWFVPSHYSSLGFPYYQWIMAFGALIPFNGAVAAFFIGIGKGRIVTYSTVAANILNFLLAYLLVFGFEEIVPEMGTKGAAIATVISQSIQVLVLFCLFIGKKEYRKKYLSLNISFNLRSLSKCLKIGFPTSLAHIIEISAWAVLLNLMARVGEEYLTVLAVGQSIFILIAFILDGIQKGVIAISSNLIGAQDFKTIPKMLVSCLKLHLGFIIILALPLIFSPEPLIDSFLPDKTATHLLNDIRYYSKIALFWVWLYFIFDGISWLIGGILTAAGDTRFIMIMNAVNGWFFAILPVYIFIVVLGYSTPSTSWMITAGYGLLNAVCVFLRYRSRKWERLSVT